MKKFLRFIMGFLLVPVFLLAFWAGETYPEVRAAIALFVLVATCTAIGALFSSIGE